MLCNGYYWFETDRSRYFAKQFSEYKFTDGYILAQAPFDGTTESDFWRMIAQTGAKLVVLLTDVTDDEGSRLIKHFWPEMSAKKRNYAKANVKVNCAQHEIVCFNSTVCFIQNGAFNATYLVITTDTLICYFSRPVTLFQIMKAINKFMERMTEA